MRSVSLNAYRAIILILAHFLFSNSSAHNSGIAEYYDEDASLNQSRSYSSSSSSNDDNTPKGEEGMHINNNYFPTSALVLDMATLSNAVYHLRNRVSSCFDARAKNNATLMNELKLLLLNDDIDIDDNNGDGDGETRIPSNDIYDDSSGSSSSSSNDEDDNTYSNHTDNNDDADEPKDIYELLLPNGTECLHYSHDYTLGTQVLIVRSTTMHKYLAVAYAGTDDWKTALTDGDILTSSFGPTTTATTVNNATNTSSSDSSNDDDVDGRPSIFDNVPEGVRVHRGFNSAVFDNGGFDKVLDCIEKVRRWGSGYYCDDNDNISDENNDGDYVDTKSAGEEDEDPYPIFTTGHSLGAADSVLLGAALHLTYPNETIRTINFGCPKIGNVEWSYWIDGLQPDRGGGAVRRKIKQTKVNTKVGQQEQRKRGMEQIMVVDNNNIMIPSSSSDFADGNEGDDISTAANGSYEVFRFVNKIDLVPRLPELVFTHAGHTLQMSVGGDIKAYYDHVGNEYYGYAPVPFGWEAASYAFLPGALASHMSKHYVKYLTFYQPKLPNATRIESTSLIDTDVALYYVRDFEKVEDFAGLEEEEEVLSSE